MDYSPRVSAFETTDCGNVKPCISARAGYTVNNRIMCLDYCCSEDQFAVLYLGFTTALFLSLLIGIYIVIEIHPQSRHGGAAAQALAASPRWAEFASARL
jgi:hypothetical protein